MRLMSLVIAAALCASVAHAQAPRKKTTKTTTKTTTTSSGSSDSTSYGAPKSAPPAHDSMNGGRANGGIGYDVAGCGLGSLALGPKPGAIQIVAATLNATGMQTFGITTGTSNCDIPEMGHQAAVFIEVNREILAKDSSRGQGETVQGLAAILHCSDASAFGAELQSHYGEIFRKENNSYDATRAIYSTINSTPALRASCATNG